MENNSNHIFKAFRSIGYITSRTPFDVKLKATEISFVLPIGNCFHILGIDRLNTLYTSPTQSSKIRCIRSFGAKSYITNCKENILIWKDDKIIETLNGHSSGIIDMLLMDNVLMTLSKNNELFMWSLMEDQMGKMKQQLPQFDASELKITAMIHPKGYYNKVLIGSKQGHLELWNINTRKMVYRFGGWQSAVVSIEQSPAQDIVAIGLDDGSVHLHDLRQDKAITTLRQKGSVVSLSFRTDGTKSHLVSASRAGIVSVWDLETRRLFNSFSAHSGAISRAYFVPGEPILVTAGVDNAIRVWTLHNAEVDKPILLRERAGHASPPHSTEFFDTDGRAATLMSTSSSGVRMVSVNVSHINIGLSHGKVKLPKCTDNLLAVNPINFRTNDAIATAHENTLALWNFSRMSLSTETLVRFNSSITALTISPCSHYVYVGTANGSVYKYNVQSGQQRAVGKHGAKSVTGIIVDAANRFVVTCASDKTVQIWSTNKLVSLSSIDVGVPQTMMVHHAESGMFAVAGEDGLVRVYDIETLQLARQYQINQVVIDMAFNNDGRWLIVAARDATVRIYDIPAGTMLDWFTTTSPVTSISFSPKGEFLATTHADELGIFLWSNQMHFGNVLLSKPGKIATLLDMPTAQSDSADTLQAMKPKVDRTIATGDEEEQRQQEIQDDKGVPMLVPDVDNDTIPTQDNIDQIDRAKQIGSLVTLTTQPRSKWESLLDLDLIRQRNRPTEMATKPKSAPFFLVSTGGVVPTFLTPQQLEEQQKTEQNGKENGKENGNKKKEDKKEKKQPEGEEKEKEKDTEMNGWGDWASEDTEQDDETTQVLSKILNKYNPIKVDKSQFLQLLEKSYKSKNYIKALIMMKEMTPSAIDYEIRNMKEEDSMDIHYMAHFLSTTMRQQDDYDFVQTLTALFLRVHGNTLMTAQHRATLQDLIDAQKIGWSRVQSTFQANICMMRYFTNTLQ